MDKAYSVDGSEFNFEEVGDVFDELDSQGRLVVGEVYYESACEEVDMTSVLQVDEILERGDELLLDKIGIEFEDSPFTECSEAAKDELHGLLKAWATKHVTDRYWRCVGPTIEHKVTQADVDAANREG